jgi:predicted DNA repair protein MutK
MISAVTVFVSLLLSILWTLDDMGIRYFNRKDQELKMIGKYVGTLMPLIFGLYGMFGLLTNYPPDQAFAYAFKIVVVLYPPLAFFAAAHTHFLRKRLELLLKRTSLRKTGILEHE